VTLSYLFNGTLLDRFVAQKLFGRSESRPTVSIFDLLKVPQKTLIVPCDKPGGLMKAAPFVESIRQAYPQSDIRILVSEDRMQLAALIPFADEVISGPLHIPLWSKQVKKLCSQLKSEQFDLVFCLGTDCSLRNAAIAGASGSRLQIGFARGDLQVFNFELVLSGKTNSDEDAHRRMLSVINLAYENSWRWSVALDAGSENRALRSSEETARSFALDLADSTEQRWNKKQLNEILQHWVSNGFEPVIFFSLAEDKKVRYLRKTHGQHLRVVDKREGAVAATLLKSCNGLIALNTDYLHLAVALGVPTVTPARPEMVRCLDPVQKDLHAFVEDEKGTALAEALICLQE